MSKFWSEMAIRTEPYVPGEQSEKPELIKLNTNENPYPPSPNVFEAIKQEMERNLRLYPSPTVDTLRKRIAERNGLNEENIFIGNGSDEILGFAFMAFFDQKKAIRFPAITYSFYPVYAKLFHIPYEQKPLERGFIINPEDYFQSPGGVIFPNPNAPTGIRIGLDTIEDILKNNPDTVVIIDEAYIDFADKSAVSLINMYDNLLVIQTMSKSRSLAGLRVGFAMGHQQLIEGLTRIKNSFNSYTVDRLAIAGAEAAFADEAYTSRCIRQIIQTREWVTAEMKKHGFTVLPSQANFIFVSHYKLQAKSLYEHLKTHDVLVRYFDKPTIKNYLRITIGTDKEMQLFFKKLQMVIEELAGEGHMLKS